MDISSSCINFSAAPKLTLDVSFHDITYSVKTGVFRKRKKHILKNVSGSFRSGDLSALVGESGAGKSSLMNILAGFIKATSGTLKVNGEEFAEDFLRSNSCYVMQDNMLNSKLTVLESFNIAADLKLGNIDPTIKQRKVAALIKALGLAGVTDTRAESLSGGQLKRLAIGQELVSDPHVIFLDEPTSGLDCSASSKLIELLHLLARQGRTLVMTIHQPSMQLLRRVDRMYMVTGGRCTYTGSVPQLVPYLRDLGYKCPAYYNPLDYLIEVCSEGSDQQIERFVQLSENGRNRSWMSSCNALETRYSVPVDQTSREFAITANFSEELRNTLETNLKNACLKCGKRYRASYWFQFRVLLSRALVVRWRDPSLTLTILALHFVLALVMGLLCYGIGQDGQYTMTIFSYLYFSLMFLMFSAFSAVTLNFPSQLPVVRREHFNLWYSTSSYYVATLVSLIPIQVTCSLLYCLITYWMTGQPVEWGRFGRFSMILTIVSLVALCIGLLNGAIFDVKNGMVFGPFFIMPFTIFSGFFLQYKDASKYFQWIFQISFLKHGLVGLCLSIFGINRNKMECSMSDSIKQKCQPYPGQFLKNIGMINESYSNAVISLLIIFIVVLISAYIILRIRLLRKW